MSVINQMLKELEERAEPTSTAAGTQPIQPEQKKLPWLKVTLLLLLIIVLNICGLYAWNLYSENESLKKEVSTQHQVIAENKQESLLAKNTIKELPVKLNTQATSTNEEQPEKTESKIGDEIKVNQSKQKELTLAHSQKIIELHKEEAPIIKDAEENIIKPAINRSVVVTPLKANKSAPTINKNETPKPPEKKPSLSISRSKLSPEGVVKNKLLKAERAIAENNITTAEALFEDILLIQPEHKSARKQLSALWFGRKLYRPAINLLSQGIELHPKDIDFRLMKARVLLSQNNNEEALYVLNGFSSAKSVEYQLLIANTAQSLSKPESVISAYNQLAQLEPYKSKWWMGLAVALDRNSEFEKAKMAYQTALSTGTLSSNSAQFIRQRLSELGE